MKREAVIRRSFCWAMGSVAMAGILLTTGCATPKRFDPNEPLKSGQSIVLIGVKPERFNVRFFSGEKTALGFDNDTFSVAAISGYPRDGYVMAVVDGGKSIGFTDFFEKWSETAMPKPFSACGRRLVKVIDVPKDKVLYFGTVEFEGSWVSGIRSRVIDDFSAAQAFLRVNHKELHGRLERTKIEELPILRNCPNNSTPIPIYIPRR